jgi:hypothetical protein
MAPEETFKQDFPVMQAIANSLRENAAAINAKGAAERKQADQIVERTRQMTADTDATIARMRNQQPGRQEFRRRGRGHPRLPEIL